MSIHKRESISRANSLNGHLVQYMRRKKWYDLQMFARGTNLYENLGLTTFHCVEKRLHPIDMCFLFLGAENYPLDEKSKK